MNNQLDNNEREEKKEGKLTSSTSGKKEEQLPKVDPEKTIPYIKQA